MLESPDCSRSPHASLAPSPGRLLLVGAPRHMRHLARSLDGSGSWTRLPIVGFVNVAGRGKQIVVHPQSRPVPVLGRLDRLNEAVDRSRATDVVVALPRRAARRVRAQLDGLGRSVRVHWVNEGNAPTLESPLATTPHSQILEPRIDSALGLERALKRLLDVTGSALGLLALSPFLIFTTLAILLTTGRPIFYTQERVGKRGKLFHIWKFRSMRLNAEAETGPIWAEDHDRRCTRIGDWLRHTNIDELPQLFNVLKGDMSLVGPRPERPIFVDTFKSEHADYDLRHAVPVGMTGWAQVHGWRGRTSLRKRIQYDLDYIGRWSFWLDVSILFMTVEHVLFGRTSWAPRKTER